LINNRKLQYLNLSWNNLRKVEEKQSNLLLYSGKDKAEEIKDEKTAGIKVENVDIESKVKKSKKKPDDKQTSSIITPYPLPL
jgi:hypothetical protein